MPLAVYALALAAFAVGTAEFIISGILPPLAADLAVSIPTAGLLVTAYAIGVAIGGPLLTLFTARFPPRYVLLSVMAVFVVSQLLCALAPDYGLLLAARLLAAAGHGVFFGAGTVVVSRLVPIERRGRAFSLFIGGITVANLLGLPGGTAIGNAFGWRMTFLAVALLGVVALVALTFRLPGGSAQDHGHSTIRNQIRALRHQQVWMSYLIIATVLVGALCFGTYQVAMLLEITRVDASATPVYLLLGGVGSVVGIYVGGRLTDWKPMPSLIVVLLLQALSYLAMLFTMPHAMLWAINLFIGGATGFAFSTPMQARIIHAARKAPNLASALVSTAFNVGIAGGAFLGAMLLNAGVSYAHLPLVGMVTALLACGIAVVSWLWERSASAAIAPPA